MSDDEREIKLRYPGTCSLCNEAIAKGASALYNSAKRSVRHISCVETVEHGTAGSSAMREYERRKARDDARIAKAVANVQDRFGSGTIGKIATFLAVDDRPRRSTKVWEQGAVGEERVAASLDALEEVGVVSLHDRRIPGTRANIDHIATTPWGVWVVDAKRYLNKKIELEVVGGFLGIGGRERLRVGGRDQTKLVDGVLWQVEQVRKVIDPAVVVAGSLCFVEGEWPLLGGAFTIQGVHVCWPKRLPKTLLSTSPPILDVQAIGRQIAAAFPSA